MVRFESIETDIISPGDARAFLSAQRGKEISSRMLSHVVVTTIGEAEIPASGRGSKRGFTLKDLYMMDVGSNLSLIGLAPHRVRLCIEGLKNYWRDLFPEPIPKLFTPE